MTNAIVFSFQNVAHDSMIASNKIARFVSEELDVPIVCDESIENYGAELDVLLIINGAYAFCKYLEKTARAIRSAKQIVWIQNDYTIIPPKAESGAESPFRKAFRERHASGRPGIAYWSTVREPATMGTRSSYVNWNSLTFDEATTQADVIRRRAVRNDALLYYGAYRMGRRIYFERYFGRPVSKTVISDSTRTGKFGVYDHENISITGKIGEHFYDYLGSHGLGLYLEDKASHSLFCSPANRFYEMLSAGLPMVFQPECGTMMRKAGFNPEPYYVRKASDVPAMMQRSEDILWEQRKDWIGKVNFRAELQMQLKSAWKRMREALQ